METDKVYSWDPEVDKNISVTDVDESHVEATLIDRSKNAFEKFENITYKCGPGIDFKHGFVIGAHSKRSTFETIGEDILAGETPLQKLSRLQGEVADMVSYLQTLDQLKSHQELNGETPGSIIDEMQILKNAIEALMRTPEVASGEVSVSALTGKVSADIAARAARSATQTASGDDAVDVRYEIICPPERVPRDDIDASRILTLENRLSAIEVQIGSKASVRLPFSDVTSGLEELALRVVSVDPEQLERASRKAKTLVVEIDELSDSVLRFVKSSSSAGNVDKDEVDDHGTSTQTVKFDVNGGLNSSSKVGGSSSQALKASEALSNDLSHVDKVNALYNLCFEWRQLAGAIPLLSTRLRTMKAVHQNSVNVAARVQTLETQQKQLGHLLQTAFDALESTREAMKSSLEKMAKSAQLLEDRMAKFNV
eukprot:GDKJ01012020.1.p1 GENE.GDKJ01012020.1~~GDKJ01012020.1.p1  ORF type:complete len:426 (-),score=95.57 GDKJ01012020.1:162-1439(-)